MKATVRKGKVLCVRVGVENRPQYFGRNWAQRDRWSMHRPKLDILVHPDTMVVVPSVPVLSAFYFPCFKFGAKC
jgi:hypothetical protein